MNEDDFFVLLRKEVERLGGPYSAAYEWKERQPIINAVLRRKGSPGRNIVRPSPAMLNGMGYTKIKTITYTYEKKMPN